MIPSRFESHLPNELSEALSYLREYKGDSKILAGGQSLVPMMKLRIVSPRHLIDLGRIHGLDYIKETGNELLIGSMTTHHEVATSPKINSLCHPLAEAAKHIGDQQVRNRGTIGGAVCHADPAADIPTALVTLDAELKCVNFSGERMIKARDMFRDVFTTALNEDEILTEVAVPALSKNARSAYLKYERVSGDFAIVSVCVVMTVDDQGACTDARIGLGGVGSIPFRAERAELELRGKIPTNDLILEAARKASEQAEPSSDIRGSAEYKREMVKIFVRDGLRKALGVAKE